MYQLRPSYRFSDICTSLFSCRHEQTCVIVCSGCGERFRDPARATKHKNDETNIKCFECKHDRQGSLRRMDEVILHSNDARRDLYWAKVQEHADMLGTTPDLPSLRTLIPDYPAFQEYFQPPTRRARGRKRPISHITSSDSPPGNSPSGFDHSVISTRPQTNSTEAKPVGASVSLSNAAPDDDFTSTSGYHSTGFKDATSADDRGTSWESSVQGHFK